MDFQNEEYKTELMEDRMIHGQRETTYEFTSSTKNKTLDVEDVENLNNDLKELEDKGVQYLIRIMNSQKIFTVKSYNGPLDIDSYENYYKNKVADPIKFDKILRISIQILHPK